MISFQSSHSSTAWAEEGLTIGIEVIVAEFFSFLRRIFSSSITCWLTPPYSLSLWSFSGNDFTKTLFLFTFLQCLPVPYTIKIFFLILHLHYTHLPHKNQEKNATGGILCKKNRWKENTFAYTINLYKDILARMSS